MTVSVPALAATNQGQPPGQSCKGLMTALNSPGSDHRSQTATDQLSALVAAAQCQQ
jgi:hypothetical protein